MMGMVRRKTSMVKTCLQFVLCLEAMFLNLAAQPLTFEKLKTAGLNLYYQPEPESQSTTVFICFPGGQRLESPLKPGLAYLTTRLMTEIPDEDKVALVEEAGLNLRVGVAPDFSYIQLDSLNQHLEKGLKVLSDTLRRPIFSGLRIDALKKLSLSEEGKERTRLVNSARLLLLRKAWPGLPYGNSIFGSEKSLKRISKKDITAFHSFILNPDTIFLSVISSLKKEEIISLVEKYFRLEKRPDRPFPSWATDAKDSPAENEFEYAGPKGAAAMVGFVLNGELSSIYPAAFVLEKIIGEGPGSALWKLRQDMAFAYNVNSQLEIFGQKIILLAYLETDPELAETALNALLEVFKNLAANGLAPHEIEKGRLLAGQSFFRESFHRDSRLSLLATFLTNSLPLEFFNSFADQLLAVTPDSVNELLGSSLKPEQALKVIISKN